MFENRLADLDKVIAGYAEAEKAARTFLIKIHEPFLNEDTDVYVDSIMKAGAALRILKTMQEERKIFGNCDCFFETLADKKTVIQTTIREFKQFKAKV